MPGDFTPVDLDPRLIADASSIFGSGGAIGAHIPDPPEVDPRTLPAPLLGFTGPKPLPDDHPIVAKYRTAPKAPPPPAPAAPAGRLSMAPATPQDLPKLVAGAREYLAAKPWEKWYRMAMVRIGLPPINQYPAGVWDRIIQRAKVLLGPSSSFLEDWARYCQLFGRSGWSPGKVAQFAVVHAIGSAQCLIMAEVTQGTQAAAPDPLAASLTDDPMGGLDNVDESMVLPMEDI